MQIFREVNFEDFVINTHVILTVVEEDTDWNERYDHDTNLTLRMKLGTRRACGMHWIPMGTSMY